MSIRSGALTAANKFAGCKDSDPDADILKRVYATYVKEDAGRWPRQLKEVLAALKTVTPKPDKPTAGIYIVQAVSYKDKKLANSLAEVLRQRGFNTLIKQDSGQYKIQCGSFSNRANADKLLSCIRQCGFDAVIKTTNKAWVGKCTGDSVNVRKGSGIGYDNITGYPKLNAGDLVDVINTDGDWYQVLIAKKYSGYVAVQYISKV